LNKAEPALIHGNRRRPTNIEMDQQEQLFTIQQLSKKLNIPKPTLRFWEKELEGLFVPLRTSGGQRRYTAEHISTIEEIKRLKGEGMSLLDIRRAFCKNRAGNISNTTKIDLLLNRITEVVKAEIASFLESEGLNSKVFEIDEP
jgi:DNA-binding transcriptional MerR regulator